MHKNCLVSDGLTGIIYSCNRACLGTTVYISVFRKIIRCDMSPDKVFLGKTTATARLTGNDRGILCRDRI